MNGYAINHELNVDCKFNNLTVLAVAKNCELIKNKHSVFYVCECDCGSQLLVRSDHVLDGRAKQCSDCSGKNKKSLFVEYVGGEILEL